MIQLVLVRHGQSVWNKENIFTGWTDVELSDVGYQEAEKAGQLLKDNNFKFDVCYTSVLKRAINTAEIILKEMDLEWIPIIKDWRLNERHYGALQGENKEALALRYGKEQVKIWRRSYDVAPPALVADDTRNPIFDDSYKGVPLSDLPLTESLKDTARRVIHFFQEVIVPELKQNRRILISAHGNSLRALRMYLDNISSEDIVKLEIPTGSPFVYDFDKNMQVTNSYYV